MALTLGEYLRQATQEQQPTVSRPAGTLKPFLGTSNAAPERPTIVGGALRAGFNELQAMGAGALSALGGATGWQGLEEFGAASADKNLAEAQQYGRPDLEIAPWEEGGAGIPSWLAYQTIKQVPQLAAAIVAGVAMPEAVIPAALSRVGAVAPRFLGGGALKSSLAAAGTQAGAQFAARKAALEAGEQFARNTMGALAVGYPMGVGAMYNEARADTQGGASQGDALAALAMGVPYAALDTLEVASVAGIARRGLSSKNILKRAATGAVAGSLMEAPQEAVQTSMELAFRDDLSPSEKAGQIVAAAVTGAAVGGTLGGTLSGIRRLRSVDPTQVTASDLTAAMDEEQGAGQVGTEQPYQTPKQIAAAAAQQRRAAKQAANEAYMAGLTPGQQLATQMLGATPGQRPRFVRDIPAEATAEDIIVQAAQVYNSPAAPKFARDILIREGILEEVTDANGTTVERMIDLKPQIEANTARLQELQTLKAEVTASKGLKGRGQMLKQLDDNIAQVTKEVQSATARQAVIDRVQMSLAQQAVASQPAPTITPAPQAAPTITPAPQPAPTITPAPQAAPAPLAPEEALQVRRVFEEVAPNSIPADFAPTKAEVLAKERLERAQAAYDQKFMVRDDQVGLPHRRTPSSQWGMTELSAAVNEGSAEAKEIVEAGKAYYQLRASRDDQLSNLSAELKQRFPDRADQIEADPIAFVQSALADQTIPTIEPNFVPSSQQQETGGATVTPLQRPAAQVIVDGKPAPSQGVMDGGLTTARKPRKAQPAAQPAAAAAPAPTTQVGGVTLPNIPGVTVQPRNQTGTGTTADARIAAARRAAGQDTDLDRARAAAKGKQKPLKADKATQDFVRYLGNLSEQAMENLRTVFTAKDNPFTNPNFDAAKTKEKLGKALKAAKPVERVSISVNTEDVPPKVTEIAEAIRAATQDWKSDNNIIVIDTIDDLRPEVREAYEKANQKTGTLGFVDPETNDVYVVASAHSSTEQAVATVYHEQLGHLGLRGQFGDGLRKMLLRMYKTNANLRREVAEWKRRYGKGYEKVPFSQRVEEALANMSERGQITGSLRDAVVLFLKNIARRFGMNLAYTDAEINQIISQAHKRGMFGLKAKEGTGRYIGDEPVGSNVVVISRLAGGTPPATAGQANSMMTRLSGFGDKVGDAAKRQMVNMSPSFRTKALYFMSLGDISSRFDKLFKGRIAEIIAAHRARTTYSVKQSQIALLPYQRYEALHAKNEPLAKMVRDLMELTFDRIDPRKTWDQHTWLKDDPKAAELKKKVEDGNAKLQTLKDKGAARVYFELIAVNEGQLFAQQGLSLWELLASNTAIRKAIPSMREGKLEPMDQFVRSADLHNSPKDYRAYWMKFTENLIKESEAFLKTQRGATQVPTDADGKKLQADVAALRALLRKVRSSQNAISQSPYFHLGRFGDYFVAFDLKSVENPPEIDEETGEPKEKTYALDRDAARLVQDRLVKEGFTDPTIAIETSDQRRAFIRVDTEDEYLRLAALMRQMHAEGMLGEKEVIAGKRDSTVVERMQSTDQVVQNLLRNFTDTPIPEELSDEDRTAELKYRERVKSDIRRWYVDLLPDIADAKVLMRRENVQGFSHDMMRSYAYRSQVAAHALANISAMGKMTKSMADMRNQVLDMQKSSSKDAALNAVKMREVMRELLLRENQRASHEGFTWVDRFKAYNHAYFLGMSPAYVMSQLTQPMTLLWPEIAKKQGFTKAAKTIAKVTPLAMRVVKATIAEGARKGLKNVADNMVTEDALRRAGIPEKDIDFIMRMVNTGGVDIGAPSREHGRIVEGRSDSREELALRYASSMGYYSEVMTRVLAALAARDALLAEKKSASATDVEAYAMKVIDTTMLNYSQWYISRASGRNGMLGPVTPLAFSFLQYSFQVIELLMREINTAFVNAAATKQEKKEARRFLAAHMTAITFLAGSLGLPAATVFARVIEVMADTLGDDEEPYDAKAAWRNFLADVFGKDIGEVLARGVPRALNMDFSGRVGEADIIPFTKLLTDKREWKEAVQDWAFRTMGAPTSMVTNVLSGGNKLMQGDAMGAMREALPVALRGPLEAGRMTSEGTYIDKSGNVLPVTPGAADILVQLLGVTPANKAELNEASQTQRVRDNQLRLRAQKLRQRLGTAMMQGDTETARELLAETQKFDQDNPAYAVLPGFEQALERRAEREATARSLSAPLGLRPTDLEGLAGVRFGNY